MTYTKNTKKKKKCTHIMVKPMHSLLYSGSKKNALFLHWFVVLYMFIEYGFFCVRIVQRNDWNQNIIVLQMNMILVVLKLHVHIIIRWLYNKKVQKAKFLCFRESEREKKQVFSCLTYFEIFFQSTFQGYISCFQRTYQKPGTTKLCYITLYWQQWSTICYHTHQGLCIWYAFYQGSCSHIRCRFVTCRRF